MYDNYCVLGSPMIQLQMRKKNHDSRHNKGGEDDRRYGMMVNRAKQWSQTRLEVPENKMRHRLAK